MGDLADWENGVIKWPEDLPQLKNLDDRLHCPICYNYMRNPVLSTTCSHSFCSLCIRHYVTCKNTCPICFVAISDGVLRPNRCLEEIIKCFQPIKNFVLKTIHLGSNNKGKQLKSSSHEAENHTTVADSNTSNSFQPSKDLNRSIVNKSTIERRNLETTTSSEATNAIEDTPSTSSGSKTSPQLRQAPRSQQKNGVECPVCQITMKETLINLHLDSCLWRNKPEKRKPLPKMIYTLMRDTELRRRLRDLGLCSTGDRTSLINRHKKYTILYNSECDAADPRPIGELKSQIEQEEAESRRLATEIRSSAAKIKTADPEVIARQNLEYIRNNKESYDQLVDEIRKRKTVKVEATKEIDSEEEITVLEVPPKVYETVSLIESSEDEEIPPKAVSSSSSDVTISSDFSIPDPQSTSSSHSSSNQESTSVDSSTSPSPNYSPLPDVPVVAKRSQKRTQTPPDGSFVRRISLRRRI